jgi:hypothetical protein
MAILFVPNDPLAQADAPARHQPPRPDPPAGRAGFDYPNRPAEAPHPFGSAEFLFWQCREAALAALESFATLAKPLASWQGERRLLALVPNAGRQLNAEYDRSSLSFYEWDTPEKTTWSGASTDAVAHEVGHAILDALRPDLWDSSYTEPAAFHEAFADCFALLVGLSDFETRKALLHGPVLRQENFLEAVAEDVSDGVRRQVGKQDPHSAARHAFNRFAWQVPIHLRKKGAPHVLTSEPHSFSRVFTGCFYDTLCNIFDGLPGGDEQALLEAATTAGKLLVAGASKPPEVARFFQAVGRTMILADESGRHHAAIRDGFQAHGVALGSTVMLAPTAALEGAPLAPKRKKGAGAARLAPAAKRDLLQRMRAPRGAKLGVRSLEIAGQQVLSAVHQRFVKLGGIDERLRGVVAAATESVLLGPGARSAEILGALPEPAASAGEVKAFVEGLLEHRGIQLEGEAWDAFRPTHAIRRRGDRRVLTRVRFSCRAG